MRIAAPFEIAPHHEIASCTIIIIIIINALP
jgi:hypothetical protein